MKVLMFWLGAALALGAFGWLVVDKERTVATGRTVLLELLPQDRRSWMQGDYMFLRYAISLDAGGDDLPAEGCVVLALDDRDVASFVRIDRGEPLGDGELRLRYRRRGELWLGAEAFFFADGEAESYRAARYGELRVDPAGNSVLIALRDAELRRLGRPVVR